MRYLFATLGLLGGIVGLVFTYFFLGLVMLMGGGSGSIRHVIFYVLLALAMASILTFVGGVMNPRRPTARWLMAVSGGVWIFSGLLLAGLRLIDTASADAVLPALTFAGLVVLPSVLPLASLVVATRSGATAKPTAAPATSRAGFQGNSDI